ncbi:MAG: cyclic nucleotide-binding domain-containing protein [Gammaproteobacteria bacterium]
MPDLFERLVLLKQSPVFSRVPTDDLRIVAQAMEEQQYFAGERIFEINEQGDQLYILVSGRIGLTHSPGSQDKNYFATLGAGDILGEMNLLDDLPRSATAHVLEDTTVLALEKTRLKGLIQSYPEISIGILRSLSLRLREVNARLAERRQEDGR